MVRSRIGTDSAPKVKQTSGRSMSKKKQCELFVLEVVENSNGDGTPKSTDVEFQKDLFGRLLASRLHPKWITAEDCMQKNTRGNEVFIVLYFSGVVFDHLCSLKCRVYGTVAALTCMLNRERLPKWTHPILSVTLKECIISFTGIDQDVRQTKTDLIMKMNGAVSKDLNDKTTHLVARECNPSSAKYLAATKSSIPVLSMEWVDKAWDAALKGYTVWFGEKDVYNEYKLKIFTGCVITCSGLSSSERMTIAHIVKANGGVFSPEMERNRCTHLLTDKNSGEKYRKAREWGWDCVKIVRVKWLDKCVQKGMRLQERLYEPKFHAVAKTSTPEADGVFAAHFDVSSISGLRQPTVASRSDRTLSPLLGSSSLHGQLKGAITDVAKCTNMSSDTSALRQRSSLCRNFSSRSIEEMSALDPIKAIGLAADVAYDCLENCRLFLYGFNDEEMPKWKRVVNALGATRLPDIYADLTHVVVGPHAVSSSLIAKLKEISSTVSVVTCQWLIECGKQQKMVAEKEFLHPLVYDNSSAKRNPSSTRNDQSSNGMHPDTSKSSNGASKVVLKSTDQRDVSAVHAKLNEAPPVEEKGAGGTKENASCWKEQRTKEPDLSKLFAGLSFGIDRFEEAVAEDLELTIVDLGGKYELDKLRRVNYLLLPLLHYGPVDEIVDLNADNVVSAHWMHDCIDRGEVLDPNGHPLYRPLSASLDSPIFTGCVVALSSMGRPEKETYTELLKTFGAVVQNRLVKRGDVGAQFQRNTHVVTCEASERTVCARRWQIPVVHPSWIIQSIITNEKQSDEKFAFDEESLKGFVRCDELWLALCSGCMRRPSSERPQKRSFDELAVDSRAGAAAFCTAVCSPSGDCVILQDPAKETANHDDHHGSDGDVVIIETPLNKRLKTLYGDTSQSMGSPAVDTPSRFLDPNTKFIPRFDLRDAYAVVDALHSCRTSSLSTDGANWSESMVGRVLEEAATKTAVMPVREPTQARRLTRACGASSKNATDLVSSDSTAKDACSEVKNAHDTSKKLDSSLSECALRKRVKKVDEGQRTSASTMSLRRSLRNGQRTSKKRKVGERHKNIAKQHMMTEKLASLVASYDDESGTESSNSAKNVAVECDSKRKRQVIDSAVNSDAATSSKRNAQKIFHENAIGWDEASHLCGEEVEKRAATSSSCSTAVLAKEGCILLSDQDSHDDDALLARPSTSKSVCRVEMQREEGGSRPNSIMPVATKEDVTKTIDKEPSEASAACAKMRRFIFSSLSIEDRDRLGALVKQLGAEVCSDFDDSVTHLCCGSIIRNVKLMRAVCAGKYVIVPEYIEGSHNAGRWLEESDFEWGSEANISKHTFENSRQEKLAAACHRWRVRVKETSRKAFDGWCVLFYCNQRRLPDLAKIVEDGGGTWRWRDDVTLTPDTVNTFTVALIERSQYWTVLEIDMLIDRGLRCYPLDYLSTYLMETDLNPDKFLHKDYAARLKAKDFVKLLPVMKG